MLKSSGKKCQKSKMSVFFKMGLIYSFDGLNERQCEYEIKIYWDFLNVRPIEQTLYGIIKMRRIW